MIGESSLNITFRSFNYSYVDCDYYLLDYTISVSNYPVEPSFITLNAASNSTYNNVSIFTNDATFI